MTDNNIVTIYICADATLTYGPQGSTDKIIKQSLPVCRVESIREAESIITFVGQKEYHPGSDPDYMEQRKGKPIPEHTGPAIRHRYSLENFRRGDPETIFTVEKTLTTIRDALRDENSKALRQAFEDARQGLGLMTEPTYER